MKFDPTFEHMLQTFNRSTGLNLTTEEVEKLLGVKKKPLFMKKSEHEKIVRKKEDAMRISLNNILVMWTELNDDEVYYNDIVIKYNELCTKLGKPASCQKSLIPKFFVYSNLTGRDPFKWEEDMKNRIEFLVKEVREIRRQINMMNEDC